MNAFKHALLIATSLGALSSMACGQTESNEVFDSMIWHQLWTNSPVIVKCQLKDDPREPWAGHVAQPHKFMTASIEKVFRGPNVKDQKIKVNMIDPPYPNFPEAGKSWILFLRRTTANQYWPTSYDFGIQPTRRSIESTLDEFNRIETQDRLKNSNTPQ